MTSSSRVPPLNANGMSKNMSNEMTVMSKLKALESSWEFSALHAELDVICLPEDNDDVVWVQLEMSVELGFGLDFGFAAGSAARQTTSSILAGLRP